MHAVEPTASKPTPGPPTAAGVALAWLAHPMTVLALAVLVLNDHLGKPTYPGQLTGKLSDVAGLIMCPALLAVLVSAAVPRMATRVLLDGAVVATGVGFAVAKGTQVGAHAATALWSAVWPSLIRYDPTDLIALPALAVAWRVGRHAAVRPAGRRVARHVRTLVLLPLAFLGTAATSPAQFPQTVIVIADGERVIVGQSEESLGRTSETAGVVWAIGQDGGVERLELSAEQIAQFHPTTQSCLGQVCYRVIPGRLRVERSTDGAHWQVAWEIRDGQYARLARVYPDLGAREDNLSSRNIVVAASGTGYVVYVANGRDGLLRIDADGHWERMGTFTLDGSLDAPPALDSPYRDSEETAVILIGVATALLLFGLGAAQRWSPAQRLGGWVVSAMVVAPLAIVGGSLMAWLPRAPAAGVHLVGLVALAAAVCVTVPAVVLIRQRRLGVVPVVGVTAIGAGTGWVMQRLLHDTNLDLLAPPFAMVILALGVAVAAPIGIVAAQRARRRDRVA